MGAPEMRRRIVEWLHENEQSELANGERLGSFLESRDGRNWVDFCDRMATPGTLGGAWGNELTLRAAARVLQRQIIVVSSSQPEVVIDPGAVAAQDPPLVIAHQHENHYMSTSLLGVWACVHV